MENAELQVPMKEEIEIYVRNNGERTMLNFHIPEGIRERFIESISQGGFDSVAAIINLELSVLPEWVTDDAQRAQISMTADPLHLRIMIASINIL